MNEPILTGKALIDFYTWLRNSVYGNTNYSGGMVYINKGYTLEFHKLQESFQFGVIQEWLDSIGIIIITSIYKGSFYWEIFYNGEVERQQEVSISRIEAHKQAIIKANELYNSQQCTTSTQS